jgi:hypothetical protein
MRESDRRHLEVNDLERFKAMVHFEKPDYVPVFGFPGAPGMSGGCMKDAHDRLVRTGMPTHVGGVWDLSKGLADVESWRRYWGTAGPIECGVWLGQGVEGFKERRRVENGYEIIESESGAVTRQVIDNDAVYSMPEFITYPVRDRASWEFCRARLTPTGLMPPDEMETRCRAYDERRRPLCIGLSGAYGFVRGMLGPEAASLAFYDDPELVHDMMGWLLDQARRFTFPVIERLRPEIVGMGEDLCYNHGMLLAPQQFHEFCGPYYREVCGAARDGGAELVAVDTDGNLMEYAGLAVSYGVNALFPCEVKAGNDLFALRERHPELVLFGWLEKEVVNEGNERNIEPEIMSKVPPLLERGGYFPNGDHGIQPLVTFENMCKFMTLLHEVTGNPEGEFPRMRP